MHDDARRRTSPEPSEGPSGPTPAAGPEALSLEALRDPARRRLREGEELGRGGMGVVLGVHDPLLRRDLAMKRTHDDPAASSAEEGASQSLRRLLEEAQVTAQLDHPGVVPVHDLGVDDAGRVFFTMKRIHGRTFERVLAERRGSDPERPAGGSPGGDRPAWPLARTLQVLLRVCETLAYAHSKGVVHRDVKPANVMVGRYGEVYLMDWGLAKVRGAPDAPGPALPAEGRTGSVRTLRIAGPGESDASPLTLDGQMVGTVGYMPPEQVVGGPVDARADVYAVGAMLYETLAGHAPLRDPDAPRDPRELLLRLVRGRPTPLAERAPQAPPELVAIAERALAAEPAQRFASALELGEELRAFLEGRVVRSYRTGVWVEVRAWMRRNRWLARGLLALLLLTGAAVVAFVLQQRAAARAIGRERDAALLAAERATAAQRRSEGLRLAALSSGVLTKDPGAALAMAAEAARLAPGTESASAIYRALRTHREVHYLDGHEGYPNGVRWLRDGRRLVSSDEAGGVILWDAVAGVGRVWLDGPAQPVLGFALAADESSLVAVYGDGSARSWTLADGRLRRTLEGPLTAAAPTPDGGLLGASPDGRVERFGPDEGPATPVLAHEGGATLVLDPDVPATLALSLGPAGDVALHRLDGGAPLWRRRLPAPAADLPRLEDPPSKPAFWGRLCERAQRAVVRLPGGGFALLDLATGAPVEGLEAHDALLDASFAADGRTLLVLRRTTPGVTAEVRSAADGRLRARFPAPDAAAALAPDGRRLAFPTQLEARVLDAADGREVQRLLGHRYNLAAAAWRADGRRLATAGQDGTVRVWEVRRDAEREGLVDPVAAGERVLALAADGGRALLVASAADAAQRLLRVRATDDGRVLAEVAVPAASADGAALDDAGATLHWVEQGRYARLTVDAGRRVPDVPLAWPADAPPPGRLHPAPGGQRLLVRSGDAALVFRALDGALLCRLGEPGEHNRPAWHPDGRRVVLCQGHRAQATLFDTEGGAPRATYAGHTGFVIDAVVDGPADRVATAAVDSTVRVVDLASGRLLERTAGLPLRGSTLQLGPGGRWLVHSALDHTLLDARPGAGLAEAAVLGRGPDQQELRLHPDGRRCFTLDSEQRLRFLDLDAPAAAEAALSRPLLPQDRVLFDAARALAPGSLSERFLTRPDAGWALLRGQLLLAAGRAEEAEEAASGALSQRPAWSRAWLLRMRARLAQAGAAADDDARRAHLAAACADLARALELGVTLRGFAPGGPPPPEAQPFVDDPTLRPLLERLGADLSPR